MQNQAKLGVKVMEQTENFRGKESGMWHEKRIGICRLVRLSTVMRGDRGRHVDEIRSGHHFPEVLSF
jgi:hypothetical protein